MPRFFAFFCVAFCGENSIFACTLMKGRFIRGLLSCPEWLKGRTDEEVVETFIFEQIYSYENL